MNDKTTSRNEPVDSISDRTRRALEEPHSVLTTELSPIGDSETTVVSVTSHSGKCYTVDVREERCTCPDQKHRAPAGGCKHIRRARYALGRTTLDVETLAECDIDQSLAANAPGPLVATTDGGIIAPGDGAEILDDDSDDDGRPDDCDCWDSVADLPCWPCCRDGFDTPNPAVEE